MMKLSEFQIDLIRESAIRKIREHLQNMPAIEHDKNCNGQCFDIVIFDENMSNE